MKTILALAVIISVAFAQNVIFDAAPYHYGGHLGYLGGHHGYLGNYLASGAVPGYAVWPGYFGHHGLVAAKEEEAEEDDAAVEEASRKKRSVLLAPHHGLGYLGYGHHGYAARTYSPYAYSHAYAAPYAFAPYRHLGYSQIPHGAPYYKVAAPEAEAEDDEAAVEEASRKKRSVLLAPHALAYGHHGLGHLGYATHTYVAPTVTHSYTAAVPVETEIKYKTHSYADQDEPTPADTTLVALEEKEHTAKAIHYEPKVFTYTARAHPFYYGHHALVAAPAAEEAKEEERKKRSVVLAHHGLGHLGYAHHGLGYLGLGHHAYAAAVPVTTEYKYKTISHEDTDAPTPADTTLVELVEKEHTAKAVHLAPALHIAPTIYHG